MPNKIKNDSDARLRINLRHVFEYTDKLDFSVKLDKSFNIVISDNMMRSIKNMLFNELLCSGKGAYELSRRIAHEKEELLAEKIEPVSMTFKLNIYVDNNSLQLIMHELDEKREDFYAK